MTAAACASATDPEDACNAVSLPLIGAAGAPTVVAVGFDVQTTGMVLVATATDPQGDTNLPNLQQSICLP